MLRCIVFLFYGRGSAERRARVGVDGDTLFMNDTPPLDRQMDKVLSPARITQLVVCLPPRTGLRGIFPR